MPRSEWEYTEAKDYSIVTQVWTFKAYCLPITAPASYDLSQIRRHVKFPVIVQMQEISGNILDSFF